MVNNVVLVGRLARDPEMRYTPSGTAITKFRLAVSRPPRRDAPEGAAPTAWLDIVTWGRVAENCSQYLDKGSLVAVEGRVQSRTWQTQDGQNRYAVEINAMRVQFLESRQEAERRRAGQQAAPAAQQAAPAAQQAAPAAQPEEAEKAAEADNEFGPIPEGEDIFGDQ